MERINYWFNNEYTPYYQQRLIKNDKCVLVVEYNPRTKVTCFYKIGQGKRGKYTVYGIVEV